MPRLAKRALVAALALATLAACESDRSSGLPPPGESNVGVGEASSGASGSSTGGGADPSGSAGSGGQPPVPTPEHCGCLAEAGGEDCRACIDETGLDGCADALAGCEEIGEGYCALVFDCISLCPTPDAYCVDTCLGAHDSARTAVEAYVACACAACADGCGEGSCN